ncbi:MAG: Tll0287-like domain-containing protein [Nitrospirales bacterium]
MKGFSFLWSGVSVGLISICFVYSSLAAPATQKKEVVAAEHVADFIHAILEADRTLYTTHVVQRMQEHDIVKADEAWKRETALPLPAQMLTLSGLRVKSKGSGLEYRLVSLWPIYEKNRPATWFERTGLEAVTGDPSKPFTGVVQKDGRQYFTAIYADTAISPSCVSCHNAHPLSPKRDHKLNDVIGGMVISFPLSD